MTQTQSRPDRALGGGFAKVHRRFVLAGGGALDGLDVSGYAPAVRSAARRSFVLRALDEERSLAAFAGLLAELSASGAPVEILGSLTRVVTDEARHLDICRRVVDALGGWPDDAPEPRWVAPDPRMPRHLKVLSTIVGSMCIGETVSVQMIAGVRRHATDPVIREVLDGFLADESFHSRFGWWWLDQHALTDDEHAFLTRWLPRVFASLERGARPSAKQLARARPFVPSPFGNMSPAERAARFDKAIHGQIIPGLERAGVRAQRAFDTREERAA